MPPKASSTRRQPRFASREPENPPSTRSTLSPFQKPNLPALQGTSSSRRQYSYGAAAEPLPSRPGRGLQRGQVVDLSNAVRNALIRHDEDELHDEAPSTSRAQSVGVDRDEDELSVAFETPSKVGSRAQAPPPAIREPLGARLTEESDADDNRSFAIESDYYGDATIASSPVNLPPRQAIRALSSTEATLARIQSRAASLLQPHRLQHLAQGDFMEAQGNSAANAFTPLMTRARPPAKPAAEHRERTEREGEAGSEDEGSRSSESINLRRGGTANTPAPGSMQAGTMSTFAPVQIRASPASPPDPEHRTQHQSSTSAAENLKPPEGQRDQRGAGSDDPSAANHAQGTGPGPGGSRNESNAGTGRWLNGATKAAVMSSMLSSQVHDAAQFLGRGGDRSAGTGHQDEPTIDWWQLLNPWTYVKATAWIVEATGERLVNIYNSIVSANVRRHILSARRVLPRIIAGMLALTLLLALLSAGMSSFKADPVDKLWSPVAGGSSWYSLGGVVRRIGDSIPSLSWSSRNRWGDLMDSWETDNPRHSEIDDYLAKIERAFRLLREAGKLHDASLEKLEAVVPKVVHMQLKDGKPVVAPEFWHALRDLIHEDGSFLTFYRKGIDYEMSSERQWQAIATRLAEDPTFTNKLNVSISKVESKMDGRLTLWETWVRENEAKVQQSLGSALDQIKSVGSQRERDEHLDKMVKEQIREHEHQSRFVGRDEYLRLVQSEVGTHLSEFRAELAELQPQLERFVRESLHLAKGDTPPSMSGAEVTALVTGLVRKAFADINLEALAKGKIHVYWDTELRNQVNYFSPAAGAIVDAKHSSVTYDPFSGVYSALTSHREGLRARHPHVAALQPWHDDGDCWCAARSHNHRGNPHGASLAVQLAYRVVPQHLVIEHILPGATTEPGARPRDVELYASIDDADVRERVRDFAAAHLPTAADDQDSADGWNYAPADLPERFVLVGRFVYADAELHGGVHVHRLSSELVALGADTDHVVVRAVSNHGTLNHTCFYRVRLYGHNVELDEGGDGLGGQGGWQ